MTAADLLVVGERHSFRTDGFSRVETDIAGQNWRGDADDVYHEAIRVQDLEFLRACRGETAGVPWSETIALAEEIDALKRLAGSPALPVNQSMPECRAGS